MMAVPFEEIADGFSKFRNVILHDVCHQIVRTERGDCRVLAEPRHVP